MFNNNKEIILEEAMILFNQKINELLNVWVLGKKMKSQKFPSTIPS